VRLLDAEAEFERERRVSYIGYSSDRDKGVTSSQVISMPLRRACLSLGDLECLHFGPLLPSTPST
jgi:hypothetical protein